MLSTCCLQVKGKNMLIVLLFVFFYSAQEVLPFKLRTFETAVSRAGRSLFKCPLLLCQFLLERFHWWRLNVRLHEYVYFGHFSHTFQCTNMCTSVTLTLPFNAQICVLRQFRPYLSVHKYVYFGHFNLTFQCTDMCTSAISALPFSAQICVLRRFQPYLSVHKYVYFGR
jgi:hypothetical protein